MAINGHRVERKGHKSRPLAQRPRTRKIYWGASWVYQRPTGVPGGDPKCNYTRCKHQKLYQLRHRRGGGPASQQLQITSPLKIKRWRREYDARSTREVTASLNKTGRIMTPSATQKKLQRPQVKRESNLSFNFVVSWQRQ